MKYLLLHLTGFIFIVCGTLVYGICLGKTSFFRLTCDFISLRLPIRLQNGSAAAEYEVLRSLSTSRACKKNKLCSYRNLQASNVHITQKPVAFNKIAVCWKFGSYKFQLNICFFVTLSELTLEVEDKGFRTR